MYCKVVLVVAATAAAAALTTTVVTLFAVFRTENGCIHNKVVEQSAESVCVFIKVRVLKCYSVQMSTYLWRYNLFDSALCLQ